VQFNRASDHELDVAAFTALLSACDQHPHRRPETCKSCAHRLQQIAEMYRGDFLAQFSLGDSAAFEEWAVLKREHLHQRAVDALARLATYDERRGADEQAQRHLARQIELDPWREEAHQSLMRMLARSGQRSAALAQYETCRRLLADELGVTPTLETTALYERIRDGLEVNASKIVEQASQSASLPIPPTPLVGRAAELAQLSELLENPACRLITLVGPGGIGKTRLALAVATEEAGAFTHGIAFVPLASLSSAEFLVSAIAAALGFTFYGSEDPTAQLFNYLRDKEMLIVLDNFEHLLVGASLVAEILTVAPDVTVLVTSRERLNVQGEWLLELQGLSFPDSEAVERVKANEYGAVQLFLQSARRIRSGFVLSDQEQAGVVRICRLVGGMPLGIELAAAWVRALSCQEIAHQIEQSLDFLTTSLHGVPVRHRSMQAVFDHSWRLLSTEEQQVLRRLSVFRGGFEREAAEQVAGAMLPWVSALISKSLLQRTDVGRYDLRELIRQYSAVKLGEAGEEPDTRQRHLAYYQSLAEAVEPHLTTKDRDQYLDRLETEHDNLRVALGWSQIQTGNGEPMMRLAGALYWYWFHRGYMSEGRKWFNSALARADGSVAPIARAKAFYGAGRLAHSQGDNVAARSLLEESVALWRSSGDIGKHGLAHGLIALGWLARDEGDLAVARSLSAESVALFREQGDRWGLAYALGYLGMVLRDENDFATACSLVEESVVLWRELGDLWGLANSLHHLGLVALRQGDYEVARSRCDEALTLRRELGHKQGVAYSLHALGLVALNQGDIGRAKPYFQQSQAMFYELEDKFGIADSLQYKGYLALFEGDHAGAQLLFEQSLVLARDAGPKWLSAVCLARLAGVAAVRGQFIQAVHLWAAAEVFTTAGGSYLDSADRFYYERTVAQARTVLGEAAFATAWAEGRAMRLEQAMAYSLPTIR
jgi:predicted ATPase